MINVKLEEGWLCGERLETFQGDGHYYSFKGVPYAAPPAGTFRFQPPRSPLPWDGVRTATQHGSKCPQVDIFKPEEIQIDSEDYLHLNVYTPELTPVNSLPVMVFIHGGGFKSGSGNNQNYGPDFLMPHGVVLVTFNYRLEVLGFLCLDTKEVPGNQGMKDQIAALKWVKKNISSFGGDPENVTIFGHNSGAVCAALHVLSPMSKGLFNRAIIMSGVPFCDWAIPFEPQKRAYTLGKQLGLHTDNPNTLLEFLQRVPVDKLVRTNPSLLCCEEYTSKRILKINYFTPVVEKDFGQERFLIEDPLQALKNGRINDVDVLIGYTNEEILTEISRFEAAFIEELSLHDRYSELIIPRKMLLKCNVDQMLQIANKIREYYFKDKSIGIHTMKEFVKYSNHTCIQYDTSSFMSKLSKVGSGRRYMYTFSIVTERTVYGKSGKRYGIIGMGHFDDMMYLLHAPWHKLKLEKNTKEYELVQRTCNIFTNFAKYGNPTPDLSLGACWPEYDNMNKAYMDMGDVLTVATDPLGEVSRFWRNLYEELSLEY